MQDNAKLLTQAQTCLLAGITAQPLSKKDQQKNTANNQKNLIFQFNIRMAVTILTYNVITTKHIIQLTEKPEALWVLMPYLSVRIKFILNTVSLVTQ